MKKVLCGGIIVIIASIIIVACQKSDSYSNKNENIPISEAKEFWYGNFRKSADYTSINWSSPLAPPSGSSTKKFPDWKSAIFYQKADIKVVEVPLYYQTNKIILPPSMKELYQTTEGDRIARSAMHKLLIHKMPNGESVVRITTIIPSAAYAKENNYDISHINLDKLPANFDGCLMIAGWDESIINIVEVEDGRIVRKLKLGRRKDLAVQKNSGVMMEQLVCPDPVWVPNWIRNCVYVPSGDNVQTIEEYCAEHGEWVDYGDWFIPECYDDGNGEPEPDPLLDCLTGPNPENCFCDLYGLGCDPEGGGGQPLPNVMNVVDDPCIKSSVDNAISLDCRNEITTFINNVFVNNEEFHLHFSDHAFLAPDTNLDAKTSTGPMANLTETMTYIRFNNSKLSGASKEYIAATILHEVVHSWIDYKFPVPVDNAQQHALMMSTSRFSQMVNALMEMYPNLSQQDAEDLTWGGSYDTIEFSNLTPVEQTRIIERNIDYKTRRNGTGTPC